MNVIGISGIDRSMTDRVGSKAAVLGEMVAHGERVPAGFCLTTDAWRAGILPEQEVDEGLRTLGAGPVAVRSSSTAEDLPDASFAGQLNTSLNVQGAEAVRAAIQGCWDSLRTERAVAYRADRQIDEADPAIAVVVQRMVDARVAGVLFTANPLTGCRNQSVVDATPGLGDAVADGSVIPDHYVLDGPGTVNSTSVRVQDEGCLRPDQLAELWEVGQRLQRYFGRPQDIEWAFDADGVLWLLQSRPITTLFPLPPDASPDDPDTRAYLEVGHLQGMLRPMTPMGRATLQRAMAIWCQVYGIAADRYQGHPSYVHIGGRMFLDMTDLLRSRWTRSRVVEAMQSYGPRVGTVFAQLASDPRIPVRGGLPFRPAAVLRATVGGIPPALAAVVGALARPEQARQRAFDQVSALDHHIAVPPEASTAERLRRVEELQRSFMTRDMAGVLWPLMASLLAAGLPGTLLRGLGTEDEFARITGGLAHNVTTEMDIALWRIADAARAHRTLLQDTPPAELAERYRRGELPDIGLGEFLANYGHRTAAEIDVGVPRWSEDPSPVFATIANYLRITDPGQSPERRFEHAAAEAETTIATLARRARRRPVRGRMAVFLMRRVRRLGGLRELGKFAWLSVLGEMRRQLLTIGDVLVERGRLDRTDDVMFLDFPETHQALSGTDQRELVASRRATHARELRRRSVPIVLLSDGTDAETLVPAAAQHGGHRDETGTFIGMAAAPGSVTGPARVVHDPADARLEPGEILVARTTDPGWTPLFMSAGGLVTETGALVAHGPTVAREYGLPAVICVRDATTAIRTGQRITVNGSTGTVTLEPERDQDEAETSRGKPVALPDSDG